MALAQLKDKSQRDFRLVNSEIPQERNFNIYNEVKVGNKTLSNDVTQTISISTKNIRITRGSITRAIDQGDLETLRAVSQYYFLKSGIYSRLCRYMAYLYRYD